MNDERTLSWWVQRLDINAELVCGFFMYFSRFEYALKEGGHAKARGEEKRAEPNWETFASSLVGKLFAVEDGEFKNAVAYLDDKPPLMQVVNGEDTDWRTFARHPKWSDERWVLEKVRMTRNNLFHGGKFPPEPARDERLLRACLTVLRHAMKLSRRVEHVFFHE
jgi:hypothetical protein